MRAPSVRVSCSLLILQLIKPNILDGVSTGLLGAGPLPHCPGTGRQEGQVGGGEMFSPGTGGWEPTRTKDICSDKHWGCTVTPETVLYHSTLLPQMPARQTHRPTPRAHCP